MDAIISKHAVNREILHQKDLELLAGVSNTYTLSEQYYFFFESELSLSIPEDRKEYVEMKNKYIRHLIPYKGHYYDYVVNKEYDTLNDWAIDNNKTVDSILYGYNSRYSHIPKVYITLNKLLKFLNPKYTIPESNKITLLARMEVLIHELTDIMNTLQTMN